MYIDSKGFTINNFFIPPFTVSEGELVIIGLPGGGWYYGLFGQTIDFLTQKKPCENLEIMESFTQISFQKQSLVQRYFFPVTVSGYFKKYENAANSISNIFYKLFPVSPSDKVKNLNHIQQKVLALLCTLSCTDKIIFDVNGLSAVDATVYYSLIKDYIYNHRGAAILLDWSNEFENNCSRFVKAILTQQ